MESNDLKWVFDTVLLPPGMDATVRIDLRMSRKAALFLANVIERGMRPHPDDGNDLYTLSTAVKKEEVEKINEEILEKAGISAMYRKLCEIHST